MDLVKKQKDIDFDMISVFYRDLFVRSVERVMVIVRINKIKDSNDLLDISFFGYE